MIECTLALFTRFSFKECNSALHIYVLTFHRRLFNLYPQVRTVIHSWKEKIMLTKTDDLQDQLRERVNAVLCDHNNSIDGQRIRAVPLFGVCLGRIWNNRGPRRRTGQPSGERSEWHYLICPISILPCGVFTMLNAKADPVAVNRLSARADRIGGCGAWVC